MSAWQAGLLAYVLVSALVAWALWRVFTVVGGEEPSRERPRREVPKSTS